MTRRQYEVRSAIRWMDALERKATVTIRLLEHPTERGLRSLERLANLERVRADRLRSVLVLRAGYRLMVTPAGPLVEMDSNTGQLVINKNLRVVERIGL